VSDGGLGETADFRPSADGLAREYRVRYAVVVTPLLAFLVLLFGWLALLEPSLEFRIAAALVAVIALVTLPLAAILSIRRMGRLELGTVRLSPVGVEYYPPKSGTPVSARGGSLFWSEVGRVVVSGDRVERRCGTRTVYLYHSKYRANVFTETLPVGRPGIIAIPWLPASEAEAMGRLANLYLSRARASGASGAARPGGTGDKSLESIDSPGPG